MILNKLIFAAVMGAFLVGAVPFEKTTKAPSKKVTSAPTNTTVKGTNKPSFMLEVTSKRKWVCYREGFVCVPSLGYPGRIQEASNLRSVNLHKLNHKKAFFLSNAYKSYCSWYLEKPDLRGQVHVFF